MGPTGKVFRDPRHFAGLLRDISDDELHRPDVPTLTAMLPAPVSAMVDHPGLFSADRRTGACWREHRGRA
jgi:hypothetical protein